MLDPRLPKVSPELCRKANQRETERVQSPSGCKMEWHLGEVDSHVGGLPPTARRKHGTFTTMGFEPSTHIPTRCTSYPDVRLLRGVSSWWDTSKYAAVDRVEKELFFRCFLLQSFFGKMERKQTLPPQTERRLGPARKRFRADRVRTSSETSSGPCCTAFAQFKQQ